MRFETLMQTEPYLLDGDEIVAVKVVDKRLVAAVKRPGSGAWSMDLIKALENFPNDPPEPTWPPAEANDTAKGEK